MKRIPIALTALGMVNALGKQKKVIWKRLLAGDLSGLSRRKGYLNSGSILVGQAAPPWPAFPRALKQYECRNNALVLAALEQMEPDVLRALKTYGARRIGVVMGSSTSGLAATEAAFAVWRSTGNLPRSFDYVQHEMGGLSQFISDFFGLEGPAYTVSTACSSSAKVLASGRALIQQGLCDAVLAGGADSLCRLTVQGFQALEALSKKPCNSMSRRRDGFNIGEGAAIFLLEPSEAGIQLAGIGESSDAHHISAPDPAGRGAYVAMTAALRDAALKTRDVSYLHLHGTGTRLNDQMESRAVARWFPKIPCGSSKGMLGHTLGASGAMGVGVCWLALANAQNGSIDLPPHRWDGERDETLPALELVARGKTLTFKKGIALMSNSFGFGGSNCSVIIRSHA